MKTAISLPDDLFAAADDLASRLGVSRSELYATAVEKYVAEMRSHGVTAQLDRVYAAVESHLDPTLLAAQLSTLKGGDWE